MNENDQALLHDMLDFLRRVVRRAEGKRFEDLADDEYALGDLLVRPLEVVGEAANHVSAECRSQHPEIEWARIVGLRNRLIHGYTDVDWQVVWKIATVDVPVLIKQVELILGEES